MSSTHVDLANAVTLEGYERLARSIGVRSLRTTREEILGPSGAVLGRASAIAVIRNPWLGTGPEQALDEESRRIAPVLAALLSDRLLDALGGSTRIEAFGKAALVGLAGEEEHGGALIHTPYFGNLVREALDGTSIMCFVDGFSEAGAAVKVPMWHKREAATRSHYQSIEVSLPDAPHRGEIAVVAVAADGPRPHARIGDRTTDQPVTRDVLKGIPL